MITILTVDKPTLNNRIYPKEIMEKAIKEYKEKYVDTGRAVVCYGLNYDNYMEPSLHNACGLVESIKLDGDDVNIELKYLDTLAAKTVLTLHKDDVTWTPVGVGKLVGNLVTEFELISIAVVPNEKFPL